MDSAQAANVARAFHLAHQRCEEMRPLADGRIQMLAVPGIVCVAFACEVGLKALLLQKVPDPRGHGLLDLFKQLAAPTRASIRAKTGIDDTTFQARLAAASEVFVDWRYVYEKPNAFADLAFLRAFSSSIQQELGN